ncbi:hypothetical protein BN2475_40002 [Paraburkholderia ribeironis]|uniref:Uncharacterized protein n=1 Tax=Paraburkholderia ribeironis TaxID=1247936 RepID=A0A1N7RJ24_9BURK|nr:hypothetical protein BN2475_40002 [Paraburkholderia ribeironis]
MRHDAGRADHLLGFLELGQHLAQPLVILAPRLGRRDAPRGAVQQARAKLLFKVHHVLARHRRRHLHPFGRADEAANFDHMAEHFHADEGIHLNRSLQESIDAILPRLSKNDRQIGAMRKLEATKLAFRGRRALLLRDGCCGAPATACQLPRRATSDT